MRLTEQQLNEMARVGDVLNCEVFVNSGEGYIPHFHIWDNNTKGDEFHSCIRLDTCDYFSHTGKEDKLNAKLKKALVKFLTSKPNISKRVNFNSYWEVIIFLWNISNPGKEVDENLEMPNYLNL